MPIGGGGGSSIPSNTSSHITQTVTNPVIPDEYKPLANSLNAIATGLTGAPVNFGPIPGFDAPATQRTPGGSLGSLLANIGFQQGANRINPVTGRGVVPQINMGGRRPMMPMGRRPFSWGDLLSLRNIPMNQPTNTQPGAGAPPPVNNPNTNLTVAQPRPGY